MKNSFKGGIWPIDHKYTLEKIPEIVTDPDIVSFNLYQYDNVTALPVVKPGTHVFEGQLIAEIPHGMGVPLHSSVSGTVAKIEPYMVGELKSYVITIENDHEHIKSPTIRPFGKKLSESTLDEIISTIRSAGILDDYGPSNPVYARIKTARTIADKIIINFTEPEPFLTARHHAIMENMNEIVGGAKILLMALGIREAVFAIEKSRKDEIDSLNQHIQGASMFNTALVTSKYPVHMERQLVSAVDDVKLKKKSAIEAGYAIFSAEVCYLIYEAFAKGMPHIQRYVTLDGDCIETPRILKVPVGTHISHLISSSGGITSKPTRVVIGGPLSGRAIESADEAITKTTEAVIVLGEYFSTSEDSGNCIHCTKCVEACPQGLYPFKIAEYAMNDKLTEASELLTTECIGCSSCSYVCPSKIPVSAFIEMVKEVM